MKGIITSRARKVGWRRCTLARVSDALVALEPARTGAVKAARSPRGGSIERPRDALKQYEYPICEITKTGLLPPGVINTGEFVHHRACGVWAGGHRDAPFFLSGAIARSRTGLAHACGRPARHDGRSACACHCKQSNSPALQLQRDASPWRAKMRRAPARAAACAALRPANEPRSGVLELQSANLYLASHRHSRRRAGVQNRPARPLHTALTSKCRGVVFKQLRRDSTHGRNCVRYDAGGRDAQAQAAEESFQTAVGCGRL